MGIGSNRAAILIFPVELLRVRSHLLYPLFDTLTVCSPASIPTEDGVLPTKLPSISISAPKGSDEISAVASPVSRAGLLEFVTASPKPPAVTPAGIVVDGDCTLDIVEQHVDDVKTDESRKSLVIANDLLDRLKVWKQFTEFPESSDWIFASPLKLGRLPYSYTGFWRELDRAGKASGIGHIGTHTFRHSYRMWIDAVGTPIGVQQKLMRHADIRTTMNIYGDAASADMREAHGKIVQLALHAERTARKRHGEIRKLLKEWLLR
jgi:hypothetical protein